LGTLVILDRGLGHCSRVLNSVIEAVLDRGAGGNSKLLYLCD